jgi:hypothetical protein
MEHLWNFLIAVAVILGVLIVDSYVGISHIL